MIENCAAIDYMYGPITGVGANIKKLITKWMNLEASIMTVHTMKNIAESIKINKETFEKCMLSQAVEDLIELYVSMSKDTVLELVQK